MDFLRKLWQNPMLFLKGAAAVVVVVLVASFTFSFVGKTMRSFGLETPSLSMMGGAGFATNKAMMYDSEMAQEEAMYARGNSDGGWSGGDDAEDYEVTEYNASYRTSDKEPICAALAKLKDREAVIFENSNEYETGCSYTFKVDHEQADDVLRIIEDLDPENLSVNTYTIQRSVEYVTSEVEILEQKLASINETLDTALAAYDEIAKIATSSRDAESLATIIDSKVRLIERLTQDKITVTQQIARMERNKNDQMQRLDYTYFYTNVYEDKYVDGERIKDSWKVAVQDFIREGNEIIQAMTVGIITFCLYVLQLVLYFFILLYVARFSWKRAKRVWNS